MTINYTSLLSLAEPVTGTQSGTWGDDVNQGLTDYLDIAIAGAQVISGSQTAVTLSKTTGSSAGSNIAQVGGAGTTGSSQYAVINCTGNPASMLTITAPATSKTYVVINSTSTSQSVKLVGTGPTTGVTVATGQAALVAWKGADFTLIATTDASKLTGTLGVANGGTGQTTANAAFNALAPSQASANGKYLKSDGTNTSWDAIDISTADITGVLAPANGGTGVNNGSSTITIAGNVTHAGAFTQSFTATGNTSVTLPTTGTLATLAGSETLTNKRVTSRVVSITSASTITPTGDTADQYNVTALAVPASVAAPSGTPTDGQKLILRLKDDGTARALTWTTTSGAYRVIGTTLPTTTVATKTTYVGCIYNATDVFWDVVAVTTQA